MLRHQELLPGDGFAPVRSSTLSSSILPDAVGRSALDDLAGDA